MRTLVVYFSKFGNTRLVAEAIAEAFNSKNIVKIISSDGLTPETLKSADLVIMGTPTHKMNLPEVVKPVLDRLPRKVLKGKSVAAFDTSYKMSAFLSRFTAAKKLDGKLRKLGGRRLAPPETFHVIDKQGPLYDGELERAREWSKSLLTLLPEKQLG